MKLSIIGAGNMGGAIARGLSSIRQDISIAISNPSPAKLDAIKTEFPQTEIFTDNRKTIENADIILLAVKPWLIESVLNEIAEQVNFKHTILVSVAAGISLEQIASFLPCATKASIFQAMPNTAISVGQSMTFICHNENTTSEQIAQVKSIFDALGRCAIIEERLMPAATALCSCGIAFAMRYVRAATEGGVELGIYPNQAKEYVLQTLRGAVELLEATGNNPESEIDKVTTPGGITIRGLNAMEANGFTNAVIQGLKASK